MRRELCAALAAALVSLAGCGPAKLDEDRKYTLDAGDAQAIELPQQDKPQKITVEYTSSAADVEVLLFKKSDVKDKDALPTADETKALGKNTGKSGTFSVDLPENTPAWVVIRGAGKKTEATLHVTNRK